MKNKQKGLDSHEKHIKWLGEALRFSLKEPEKGGSPHPCVKVGAVIVNAKGKKIACASNRFAQGVNGRDRKRYQDGERSMWINCAEQMAIAQAIRKRESLKGACLYVTLTPCAVCAGLIAECGIKEVITPSNANKIYGRLKPKWKRSGRIGAIKLREAGVKQTSIDMAIVR